MLQPGDIIYLSNTSYASSLYRRQNSKIQAVIQCAKSYHKIVISTQWKGSKQKDSVESVMQ